MLPVKQITFDFGEAVTPEPEPVAAPMPVPQAPLKKKRGRKPKDPTTVVVKPPAKRGRRSLKADDAAMEVISVPDDETLFQKHYYTITQVSEMFGVNVSLIRLWENEFDVLKPRKNKKGDRFFRPIDVKNLQLIHHLLRQRKFTMEGAKEYLKHNTATDKNFMLLETLKKLRTLLLEIKASI